MRKILYITNIEVPYRIRMFNEMAKYCDLTVLCEKNKSSNRNDVWAKSVKSNFKIKYLKGISVNAENAFSLGILRYIFSDYDAIIFGCFNSIVEMFAMLIMRLFRKKYILNIDGEIFLDGEGLKTKFKKLFLKGAHKYLVAGEKVAESIKNIASDKEVRTYYFSSLSEKELEDNAKAKFEREDTILVVGQYFDYKGMDIAFETAKMTPSYKYKFVGMGKRTDLFIKEQNANEVENVEFIPFLSKEQLEEEYKKCGVLVLPSRQECWGLVVNEAASFGTPIVSTVGSGAAVEFFGDEYPEFLAKPNDALSLRKCIDKMFDVGYKGEFSQYLIEKSKKYNIEKCAEIHMDVCGINYGG